MSASMTDATRWAMTIVVMPPSPVRLARMRTSVAISTALVESSRISMRGCLSSARAMHSRWRWPPETPAPPWPSTPSSPPMRSRNSSAQARRHASSIRPSSASGSPHARFSRIVPENSVVFCSTTATASRRTARSYSRTSRPPISMIATQVAYIAPCRIGMLSTAVRKVRVAVEARSMSTVSKRPAIWSSRTYALMTRMPERSSCNVSLSRSIDRWSRRYSGATCRTTASMATAITGVVTQKTRARSGDISAA